MPDFSHRSYRLELLDDPAIPFEDIKRNMQELNFINTWLGGHGITLQGVKELTAKKPAVNICEIGCGGGDNLIAIRSWLQKKSIPATFTGIDINAHCIEVARKQLVESDNSTNNSYKLIASDYRDVHFTEMPDIIFSSLFCHHFKDEELVHQLQWMHANAKLGFFINDLHRHPAAYYSIKWLTAAFSRSYLVKNDAPLSVARGFAKKEWLQLLHKAGITNFSIHWKWAFRWLIVAEN